MSNLQTITKQLSEKYGSFLTTIQLAEELQLSKITLKKHRENGTGIPYTKIARSVRYLPHNIAKYMITNEVKVVS